LQEPISGWRLWAQKVLPVPIIMLVVVECIFVDFTYFLGRPDEGLARVQLLVYTLCEVFVAYALIDTYVRRHGADRQRIRWVVFGFAVALLSSLAGTIIGTEATNTPFAVQAGISLLSIFAPITVAYAIVRHRVIDVNFVVSRTLVYGILTTLFVALFAFVDWFVGHVLDQTRWALVAEVGVAIAVGFWLNGLHARVDRFVDSVLFRKRHEAERRLARLARGLPHASSSALVDSMLVREPVDALELASAALFRRCASGTFDRVAAVDWSDQSIAALPLDDPLVPYLDGERGALRLSELHWSSADVPTGAARPVLAFPIMVRHRLEGIALYGAHRGGEDFDPDELQWLNALAVAAGAAFDHLEAEALRNELDELKREREAQRHALRGPGFSPAG